MIIIGSTSLNSVNPNNIETVEIYRDAEGPVQLRPLTANGIINLTLKKGIKPPIKSRTLAQIGKHLDLAGPMSYAVNTQPITDPNLRIANDAIAEIKITRTVASSNVLVDIRIDTGSYDPPAPPGTVRIRGTASR
jgi:hypothetical protein